MDERRTRPRWVLPAVLAGALLLIGGVLHLAETAWRAIAPESPAPPEASQRSEAPREPIRPRISFDGDTVTIETGDNRTSIGTGGNTEDAEFLRDCITERVEEAFPSAGPAEPTGDDDTPAWLARIREGRRAKEQVRRIQQECIQRMTQRRRKPTTGTEPPATPGPVSSAAGLRAPAATRVFSEPRARGARALDTRGWCRQA